MTLYYPEKQSVYELECGILLIYMMQTIKMFSCIQRNVRYEFNKVTAFLVVFDLIS